MTKFRKLENLETKIIIRKWSQIFNNICITENLVPKYTNIRYHDPALESSREGMEYRNFVLEREIKIKENEIKDINDEIGLLRNDISSFDVPEEMLNQSYGSLTTFLSNTESVQKTKTLKKLNNLYQGQIFLKNEINCFINMSDYTLTALEKDYLNLGLNYHITPKYDKLTKETELEVLYNNLIELEVKNKITTSPRLRSLLAAESHKHRNPRYNKSHITKELKQAAKKLRENDEIIIRKADKSSLYVIMNKSDYINKVNNILSDQTKFKKITSNPTNKVKQEANKLISCLNSGNGDIKIPKILGDFSAGYIYGTVKTHKDGNPLRPIISQILTPTYQLAKRLNNIVAPYMPNQYCLKSTNDFIDIIHSNHNIQFNNSVLASLDVESLFTNVPIDTTIDIIIKYTYNHHAIQPPKIPQNILRQMLQICTKQSPFISPTGEYFLQIEGVAMGSPLGPTFANFYMGHIENEIFNNYDIKPPIYQRYVDDIFLVANSVEEINNLKQKFEENSVLKFTVELSTNNRIPFLDVSVKNHGNRLITTVHRKATNIGTCLNGNSECSELYKQSVIMSYLTRAYKVSTNWNDFHMEVNHIKQMLINNNYSNSFVDKIIQKFVSKKVSNSENAERSQSVSEVNVFYKNQYHVNYKQDERILTEIICNNTKCVNQNEKLKIIIYYKSPKANNFIMKFNPHPPNQRLQRSNVIYQFQCPLQHDNQPKTYIGFTQCSLARRLDNHSQKGSIKQHFIEDHNCKITKQQLYDNTSIIATASDKQRLIIKESLLILENNPSINKQFDNFNHTLKLNPMRSHAHFNNGVSNAVHVTSLDAATPAGLNTSVGLATPEDDNQILSNLTPVMPRHFVSPAINNRINSLINNIHNDNNYSPPTTRLRARSQFFNLPAQVGVANISETQPDQE